MDGGRVRIRLFLLLALAWCSIGCNPSTLNFLLMPFVDDKVPPACKLTDNDKEVTVAILCTFASIETIPELLPVDNMLAERLAHEMRIRCKLNKEKIAFVPAARVRSLVNQYPDISLHKLGEKLKADYVIALEINSMTLYEKGSYQRLFRGSTEISVTAIDVSKPAGEGTILNEPYRRKYPGAANGPIDVAGSSEIEFRNLFINKVAQELARYFVAYPAEVRREMDAPAFWLAFSGNRRNTGSGWTLPSRSMQARVASPSVSNTPSRSTSYRCSILTIVVRVTVVRSVNTSS
jgi:hypothetical protein